MTDKNCAIPPFCRTDFNKEKKREAKQLRKQEKAEREQEMERLKEAREVKERARQLKAEVSARSLSFERKYNCFSPPPLFTLSFCPLIAGV